MQRGLGARRHRRRDLRRVGLWRDDPGSQPSRPAITPLLDPYPVRVRNTGDGPVGWGGYIKAARERRGLTQTALARLLNIDRATIYRWESKRQRPESARTVAMVAGVLALDVDEAMLVAGLRLDPNESVTLVEPYDEELELVRTDPKLDPNTKLRIVELILERRERDRQTSLDETKRMIEIMRRTG